MQGAIVRFRDASQQEEEMGEASIWAVSLIKQQALFARIREIVIEGLLCRREEDQNSDRL